MTVRETAALRDSRTRHWLRWFLEMLVVLVLGATGLGYWQVRRAVPQLDGSLQVSGLKEKVAVTRDARGVPTIEAANLDDLFLAQGYVTAQDRLWQMDIMRRFAAGEMAELLGPDFVAHDREQRILGLRVAAERTAAALSARDRKYLEDYARGINEFIHTHRSSLPLEFRLLHYSPKDWQVEDSFLIGARMIQDLNHGTFWAALRREKILAKLGPELTADLFVNESLHDHPPALEAVKEGAKAPKATEDDFEPDPVVALPGTFNGPVAAPLEAGPFPKQILETRSSQMSSGASAFEYQFHPGSNNWVVSGAHTVSGKPLLSSDMHLGHQMPNLWYEAHLRSGDFDVVGVTLPGVPDVIAGHNRRIAWGFTNVGPTVEDVYVETFNDAGQYLTPQGWKTPERRQETIHVKGAGPIDISFDVVITRHGPVINELVPGETRKLALKWTLYDGFNFPFYDVNTAQDWQQFRKAFSSWLAPGQNVVYADVDGHIGYQATGRVPIRAAGDGSVPENGADDQHEWIGYIPFDKMPSVFDPPSGVLATANGRITPDHYPYSISTEWDAAWRTERIYRVLQSGKKFAPADMLALQTDVYSEFDHFCAQQFAQALERTPNLSDRAKRAKELMRDWDGRMTTDSAAATIAHQATRKLEQFLLEAKLGAAPKASGEGVENLSWKTYSWSSSSIWLENVLRQRPQRWLPRAYASYDALLAAALEATISDSSVPSDLNNWRWGNVSKIQIEHGVLSHLPIVGKWTGPGLHEQSGDGHTVKQVGRGFGPSERFTMDVSDFDQSTLNVVTGQAGNFGSSNYMDQWKAWYEGETFSLPFSPDAVERAKVHALLLEPAK